jgi:hypothetical protein
MNPFYSTMPVENPGACFLSEKFSYCTSETIKARPFQRELKYLCFQKVSDFIASDVQCGNSLLKKPASDDLISLLFNVWLEVSKSKYVLRQFGFGSRLFSKTSARRESWVSIVTFQSDDLVQGCRIFLGA